ncbi:hypothetical protein GPALN_004480 [Globodera pallida]|nr:hypothetical protein GPALN_004480 [Globodera pallida]
MFSTINLITVLIVLLSIPMNAFANRRHNGTSGNSASSEEGVVSGQLSNRFGQFENRGNAAGGQRGNPFMQRGNFVEQPGFPLGERGNPFRQSDNQAAGLGGGMPFGERGYGVGQGGVEMFGQRGNQF